MTTASHRAGPGPDTPFRTLLTNRLRAALLSHRARARAKETA
ncbi:hypothetical protein [Streptomyces sp. NPDC007088]